MAHFRDIKINTAQGAGPLRDFIGLWAHCSLFVSVYEHTILFIKFAAEEEVELHQRLKAITLLSEIMR